MVIKKRRLIAYGTLIMKYIRVKYCFIILIFFVIYQLLHSSDFFERYFQKKEKIIAPVHLSYLVVHFDLKGMPPKLSYLAQLVRSLKVYGVNAILMEYEDMFPYEGRLVNLSARNCYDREQLKTFISAVHASGIDIIPLVQTFGHMEYVLKLKEFMHLREKVIHPSSICPSKNESIELISEMLKQIIDFHTSIAPLGHIHIGCDEVYNLNDCLLCRKRKMQDIVLFLDHVKRVDNIVTKLTPRTKVLIWNDMLLKKYSALQRMKLNLNNIEPVYWDYREKFNISHKHLYEQHKVFRNIWIASAFKGADSDDGPLPNITKRFRNNRQWLKHIAQYQFGGENHVYHFKGMILTGWSRRTHMAPPMELIISAIPSLFLNLLLIKAAMEGMGLSDLNYMNDVDLYEKYIHYNFYNIIMFNRLRDNKTEVSLEHNHFHKTIEKFFELDSYENKLRRLKYLKYEFRIRNIDMFEVERGIKKCRKLVDQFNEQTNKIRQYMGPYYEVDIIDEYITYKVGIHIAKLEKMIDILQNYSNVRFWERRPNVYIEEDKTRKH